MKLNEIDLEAEISRVQGEIEVFRDECLPAMLGGTTEAQLRQQTRATDSLSAWQDAARRLAKALSNEAPLHAEAFREFGIDGREFVNHSASAWRFQAGRIRWRIRLFIGFDGALLWYPAQKEEQQRLSASADWPTEHRIEIEAGLLNVGAGGQCDAMVAICTLGNAFCFVLPWIADVDPPFAKMALDKETWRTLLVTNHALSASERDERLRIIDGRIFGHMLNNALLHVLGALANNHFLEIREYLRHPNLRGGYTYHMPRYLFTVLFEKVAVLRTFQCGRMW
jgi:hypothetical protein